MQRYAQEGGGGGLAAMGEVQGRAGYRAGASRMVYSRQRAPRRMGSFSCIGEAIAALGGWLGASAVWGDASANGP